LLLEPPRCGHSSTRPTRGVGGGTRAEQPPGAWGILGRTGRFLPGSARFLAPSAADPTSEDGWSSAAESNTGALQVLIPDQRVARRTAEIGPTTLWQAIRQVGATVCQELSHRLGRPSRNDPVPPVHYLGPAARAATPTTRWCAHEEPDPAYLAVVRGHLRLPGRWPGGHPVGDPATDHRRARGRRPQGHHLAAVRHHRPGPDPAGGPPTRSAGCTLPPRWSVPPTFPGTHGSTSCCIPAVRCRRPPTSPPWPETACGRSASPLPSPCRCCCWTGGYARAAGGWW
jgi:hypothetical protein